MHFYVENQPKLLAPPTSSCKMCDN